MDYNQGISDDTNFKEILSSMSRWYDRHGYINKLKVLYRDLVSELDKLYAATKVIQLFELLITSGHLSSNNLTVLYDTINITHPFGLEPEFWKLSSTCFDIRTAKISNITRNRQILIQVIESLVENDLEYISQRYNCPQKEDIWKFFVDLEQKKVFCEENLDDFMKNITTYNILVSRKDPLGLRGTGDAATKDDSSKTSAENQEKPMVTDDTDAARNACTSTSTESQKKLLVTDDTNAPRNLRTSASTVHVSESQENRMVSDDTDATTNACTSASTAGACIVNKIISQDNKGSIIGSQIIGCNVETLVVNNTITVNQEPKDKDLSASRNNEVVIRNYLDQWQRKVYKYLNKMTPPTWNQESEIDLAEVFTDLELLQKKGHNTSKDTTLQELISLIQSQRSCKVFVEGKGGMGKSTLLKHLAYHWANKIDDPFPEKIVFLVNLRDLKKDEDVVDVIIRQINKKDFNRKTKLDTGLIEDFLMEHDDEIVLLLDGYDELEKSAQDPVSLFERKELENSQVILTSRPENVDMIVKKCDVHVKVDGFSSGKIKFYIRKHFKYIKMPELGESLITELHLDLKNKKNWGGRHREAFEMCRSPMLLLKICTVWKENQRIPMDKPTLFKEIFRCILNQCVNRSGTDKPISKFEEASKKYVKALEILGKCMFKSLQNNRLSINKNDLEGDEETIDLAIKLGFVYKEQPIVEDDFSEIFNTPHKLILESLVGFYICRQTRSFSIDEGDTIRSNPYLHMSQVFAIGFLGADAGEFLKHWITDSASWYCPLARYFNFVKKEHEEQVLLVLDEYMTKRIPDTKPLLEDVCTSLRGFLRHSVQSVEVKEDEDIFLLIKKIHQHVLTEDKFETAVKSWVKSVSSNISFCDFGRKLAHIFFAIELYQYLIKCVDIYGHQDVIQGISVEFEKFNFKYNMEYIGFDSISLSSSALIHVLHYAPMLTNLSVVNCGISGKDVNEVIHAIIETGDELALKKLDLNENDLSDIDMASIISLLLVVPKLHIDMHKCCLSGSNVRDLLTEYKQNMHKEIRLPTVVNNSCFTVIRGEKCLKNCENHLSDIDGLSLAFLLQEISFPYFPFKWNVYKLTYKNLQDLVHKCDEHNIRPNVAVLDISDVDLSSISGADLAKLLTLFPKLKSLVLTGCKLSGNILKDLMNELERTDDLLKLKIVNLFHNDFSDIDGSSLAKLLKVIDNDHDSCTTWLMWIGSKKSGVTYSLNAGNLCAFISECIRSCISFIWTHVCLWKINLSSVRGSTLSGLFKICPNLATLDMRCCGLTGKIISDFLNACNMNGIVLKRNIIHLDGNNLSDIDGAALAQLLMIIDINGDISNNWKKFGLTSNQFHDLIRECKRLGIVFKWTTVSLDGINISSVSGTLLAYLFKICPNLKFLSMKHCNLSGTMIRDFLLECEKESVVLTQDMLSLEGNDLSNIDGKSLVKVLQIAYWFVPLISYHLCAKNVHSFINECSGIKIRWTHLSLSGINMSSLNGTAFACLFKIFPKLINLDMQECSVSGGFVKDLLNECERSGVELNGNMLNLKHNDFSDIDGASLAKLLKSEPNCTWSDYKLNAGNLQDLIKACENLKITLKLTCINMCGINMSMVNGTILSSLLQICPNLDLLNMEMCSLSGSIIKSLMDECEKRGLELKHMFQLKGNDLSVIDSTSLIRLIDIVSVDVCFNKWTDYKLSTDNLQDFIQTSLRSDITFGCHGINLSGLDLTILNEDHLSSLFVIFPDLLVLALNDCQLSGYLLSSMLKACSENNVISKVSGLYFSKNDLSKVNRALVTLMKKIFPKLKFLGVSNCRLTRNAFKHIAEVCRSVVLPITSLNISGNDLRDLSGADVVSLSSISPNLECLNVSGCNISIQLLQAVVDGFSGRSTLGLSELDISNNDLHDISSMLLVSILKNSPKLEKLKMSKCRLVGKTVEEFLIKLPMNKSELCELDLSCNDLRGLNEISEVLFFSAFPFLNRLNLVNCQLSPSAYFDLKHFWPEVAKKHGFKYLYF
ncbi:uncharacterized protein LOC117122684 [Anneissia japonica]|uniref:uncharacterized protein LOC117122684 n=1 Tax=Anneissia japonica TaxID=1529436 RepID=UPI001425B601|nr:uncharacterized protein LOC117122684 [Anneissia japonica]